MRIKTPTSRESGGVLSPRGPETNAYYMKKTTEIK